MKPATPDFNSGNEIWFFIFGKQIQINFLSFSSRKLHKNYQMSGQMNSHICLMLGVYKRFHQTVKYGHHRNRNLQHLTNIEIKISMMASKAKIWFAKSWY